LNYSRPPRHVLLFSYVAYFVFVQCHGASAQTVSQWAPTPNSNDWFDPLNWSDTVPNSPGVVARFPGASVAVDLTADATLGKAEFTGPLGATLSGSGLLTFDNSGAEPAVLASTWSGPGGEAVVVDVPIEIATGEEILLDVTAIQPLELNGGIVSASGDVTKTGSGRLILGGDSSVWQGMFTVTEGDVVLEHVSALGDEIGTTRINGGRVLIGDDPPPPRGTPRTPRTELTSPLMEPFILETGVLETTQNFLRLTGTLELPASNTAILRGPFDLRGGTTGDGDLRIVATEFAATSVFDVPLGHAGGVDISSGESSRQFARFDIDNNYAGPTTLSNIRIDVRTPGGLGDAAAGTTITNGSDLRLHGGSAEDVTTIDSTLSLWSAEITLAELRPTGRYALHNSVLTTYGEFRGAENYVIEQPITLSGDLNTIATERGAISITGGISGNGDLILDSGFFPINVSSPISHSGSLELRGNAVRFLSGAEYNGDVVLNNGGLIVETDLQLSRILTASPEVNSCCPSGRVDVAPGASLQVQRIGLRRGLLRGSIHAVEQVLMADPYAGPTVSHVDTGLQFHVLSGQTTLDDSLENRPATNGHFSIDQTKFASVLVGAKSTTDASFYLNNGSGFNFGGALLLESDFSTGTATTIIRGDIRLGSQGAHIGGQESEVRVEGQITGGDLNLGRRRGTPGLQLVGGTAAYTGATRVFSGQIVLAERGQLANTSGIELYPEGALYLDSSLGEGPQSNRVADQVPIELYGGALSAWPTEAGVDVVQRIGAVHAARGLSSISGYSFRLRGDQSAVAKLRVGNLTRDPGAVVMLQPTVGRNFDIGDIGTTLSLNLENPPPVTNGILPPWLLFAKNQFATLGADGVETYQGPTVNFLVADETSIVRPSSSLLDRDRTVHAWSFGSVPAVDLNGHTLTIGSGGLLGAKLSNGRVMPGQYADDELIFLPGFELDVEIADNGTPTSVTYVGEGKIRGTSTYTGTTYLVGQPGDGVRVNKAAALPVGGDFEISGYTVLELDDPATDVQYRLGKVTLRDGGSIGNFSNEPTLSVESLELEAGVVSNIALAGNFPVSKRTEGYAELHTSSPDFNGRIDVYEGTLQLGISAGRDGFRAAGNGEVVVHAGGRLALAPANTSTAEPSPTPTVTLAGGDLLAVERTRSFQTNFIGDINVVGDSTAYAFDAQEDRPVFRALRINGSFNVAPGASLTIVGFEVAATEGINLAQGATLGGTGILNANVEIAAGAILSPGLLGQKLAVGTLSTDCCQTAMSWGEGGRYQWEINDAEGIAGAPVGRGWDMLLIGGELAIDATPNAPFIIEPIALTIDGEAGAVAGLKPNSQYRWLLAEIGTLNSFTATISGFAPEKFAFDVAQFQQLYPQITEDNFSLDFDDQGIHLNFFFVPEPANISLMLGACASIGRRFRRRLTASCLRSV